VTNLNDAGLGSLRDAIAATPPGGTVDFQPGLSGTITLTAGELVINKDLAVSGPGADVITVSGNQASRVFDIAASFAVSISGLTIANGGSALIGGGGGILNSGTLTLTGCALRGNHVTYVGGNTGFGGGVSNAGTLTVRNCTLSGNSTGGSPSEGGGISNVGTMTVISSTLRGNRANNSGGGIYNRLGRATVTDCIIIGNSTGFTSVSGFGGGIHDLSPGAMTVTDCIINGNSSGYGGGIYTNPFSASLTVSNSTLSGNSSTTAGSGIYSNSGLAVEGLVTIDGDYFQTANGALTVGTGNTFVLAGTGTAQGSVSNAGTLAVGDASGPGALTVSGRYTEADSGTLAIAAGSTVSLTGAFPNFSGTTLTGGTYQGGGTFRFTGANIVTNAATIVLDGPGAQIIDEEGHDALANFATNAVAGNFTTQNGRSFATAGGFSNAGILGVGAGSTVTVNGDFTQTADATLAIALGGSEAGADYSQLIVNGLATLGGTLDVQLVNGYQPQFGDLFQPLLFVQGSGTFTYYTGDASLFGPLYVYDPNPFVPTGLTLVAAGDAGPNPSTAPTAPVLPLGQVTSVNAAPLAFSYTSVPAFDFDTGLTLEAA
jgi:hypothetical protein